jgi:hypothetical protein
VPQSTCPSQVQIFGTAAYRAHSWRNWTCGRAIDLVIIYGKCLKEEVKYTYNEPGGCWRKGPDPSVRALADPWKQGSYAWSESWLCDCLNANE